MGPEPLRERHSRVSLIDLTTFVNWTTDDVPGRMREILELVDRGHARLTRATYVVHEGDRAEFPLIAPMYLLVEVIPE